MACSGNACRLCVTGAVVVVSRCIAGTAVVPESRT